MNFWSLCLPLHLHGGIPLNVWIRLFLALAATVIVVVAVAVVVVVALSVSKVTNVLQPSNMF